MFSAALNKSWREGAQIGLALVIAIFIEEYFQLPYGYWVPLSIGMIYGPATHGLMMERVKLGVFGTFIGLAAGFLFFNLFLHYNIAWAYLMPIFVIALLYFSRDKYHLSIAAALLTLVCLYGILDPRTAGPSQVLIDRLINVCLGIFIAFVVDLAFSTSQKMGSVVHTKAAEILNGLAEFIPTVVCDYSRPTVQNDRNVLKVSQSVQVYNAMKTAYESYRKEFNFPKKLAPVYEKIFQDLTWLQILCAKIGNVAWHPMSSDSLPEADHDTLMAIAHLIRTWLKMLATLKPADINERHFEVLLAELPAHIETLTYLKEELAYLKHFIIELNQELKLLERTS